MDLEELREKLYKKDQKINEEPKAPEIFEPGHKPEPSIPSRRFQSPTSPSKKPMSRRKLIFRKYFFIGTILALILILIVGGIIYWLGRRAFDKSLVSLEIEGPERVVSGEDVVYKVKIINNSKVSLFAPKLIFTFPEESILEEGDLIKTKELAELAPQAETEEEFKGKIIGLRGEKKEIKARLIYSPKNISSEFKNKARFETSIIDVPLALNLDLPSRLSNEQIVNLTVQYLNDSQMDFSDLELKMDYPPGFSFSSAHPSPDEESNIWQIDSLASSTEAKIVISGYIKGHEDETKTFRAYLGKRQAGRFVPLVQTIKSAQISLSPLSIWQTVNGSNNYIAQVGETLKYQIKYKNTTDETIKGVVITSKMEGQGFDFSSVRTRKGTFSSVNQTIVWNEANLSELSFLAPGQEGELSFSVKVKDKISVRSYQDKNFVLTNTATIDSPNVPLSLYGIKIKGESKMETKLQTDLILNLRGYFYEGTFSNSGPLPPKVGETTTYTVFWEALNYFNDVKEAKVETYLPSYIKWLGKTKPQNTNVRYDKVSGKLTWSIGDLPAGTGVLLPVKSLAFQIAFIPSLSQVGQRVSLVKESFISGQDSFTGQELKEGVEALNSRLPDDPKVDWNKGIVE